MSFKYLFKGSDKPNCPVKEAKFVFDIRDIKICFPKECLIVIGGSQIQLDPDVFQCVLRQWLAWKSEGDAEEIATEEQSDLGEDFL